MEKRNPIDAETLCAQDGQECGQLVRVVESADVAVTSRLEAVMEKRNPTDEEREQLLLAETRCARDGKECLQLVEAVERAGVAEAAHRAATARMLAVTGRLNNKRNGASHKPRVVPVVGKT